MKRCTIITVSNQKGGTGKTTTAFNLSIALAKNGKKVLVVDMDPQANLSMSFGIKNPDELEISMREILIAACAGSELPPKASYILHSVDLDIIPSNIHLSDVETKLRDEVGAENTLKELLNPLRNDYDYIIIDTNPYLGIFTNNALAACDEIIIPVSPQLWSATGLTDLLQRIFKIKQKLNPNIEIKGILLTMCDERTVLFREAYAMLQAFCQGSIRIFDTHIPNTVRVGEANFYSQSVMEYDEKSKAAIAYSALAKEVIEDGRNKREETATA